MPPTLFRCPFEIKGEREEKVLHIHLDEDRGMRFDLISAAFKRFHADRSIVSIKFHLPMSILEKATSLEALQVYLVPYQAELLAAELDYDCTRSSLTR